jgi:hypothetical protein
MMTLDSKTIRTLLNLLFVGAILLIELIIIGLLVYLFIGTLHGKHNLFTFISLALILIWFGVIIGYLSWAVYFYNINMGLTEQDWNDIARKKGVAEENKLLNIEIQMPDKTDEPNVNPYNEQTFGLPPGTVRGVLALTLLFCAVGMLVFSMGLPTFTSGNQFFLDSLEFFKTAFLMMIAFYFGSRSLEFLKKSSDKKEAKDASDANAAKESSNKNSNISETDMPANVNIENEGIVAPGAPSPILTSMKTLLNNVRDGVVDKKTDKSLINDFPHLQDEQHVKTITDEDIKELADKNGVELAAIKAVIQVETGGKAFIADGRPKILFEGHIFWNQLKLVNINPEQYAASHPDIIYTNWTKKYYLGGAAEYTRLDKAKLIHEEAALKSASWGLFQIMGFNYALAGFKDKGVKAFVDSQYEAEYHHLEAFFAFIKHKDKKNTSILDFLQKKDWAGFAQRYNGPRYKENQYDTKLQAAYLRFSNQSIA